MWAFVSKHSSELKTARICKSQQNICSERKIFTCQNFSFVFVWLSVYHPRTWVNWLWIPVNSKMVFVCYISQTAFLHATFEWKISLFWCEKGFFVIDGTPCIQSVGLRDLYFWKSEPPTAIFLWLSIFLISCVFFIRKNGSRCKIQYCIFTLNFQQNFLFYCFFVAIAAKLNVLITKNYAKVLLKYDHFAHAISKWNKNLKVLRFPVLISPFLRVQNSNRTFRFVMDLVGRLIISGL